MKKLVTVAEPALQKSPGLFLDRLKENVRSHQEWEDTEDQPEKKKRGSDDHNKNGGQKRSSTDVRGGGLRRASGRSSIQFEERTSSTMGVDVRRRTIQQRR